MGNDKKKYKTRILLFEKKPSTYYVHGYRYSPYSYRIYRIRRESLSLRHRIIVWILKVTIVFVGMYITYWLGLRANR